MIGVLFHSGWFESGGSEVAGLGTLTLLNRAVGPLGLVGCDRLLCFRIVHYLHQLLR